MKLHTDGFGRTRITLADGGELFISYTTCIAARLADGTRCRTDQVWSRTTSKHIEQWDITAAEKRPQEFFDNLLESV